MSDLVGNPEDRLSRVAAQIKMNFLSETVLINVLNEPRREKTGLWGFRPGLTQTDLYSHRSRIVLSLKFRI